VQINWAGQTSLSTLATATLNAAGQTPGQFAYVDLASPVTLTPNTYYAVFSTEVQGGDVLYGDSTYTSTGAVTPYYSAYNYWAYPVCSPVTGLWTLSVLGNHTYGPVNFKYR
jgi:hypothetical protein